jgi:hypothetical protein
VKKEWPSTFLVEVGERKVVARGDSWQKKQRPTKHMQKRLEGIATLNDCHIEKALPPCLDEV